MESIDLVFGILGGLLTLGWMLAVFIYLRRISANLAQLNATATKHSPELSELHYIAVKQDRKNQPDFEPTN